MSAFDSRTLETDGGVLSLSAATHGSGHVSPENLHFPTVTSLNHGNSVNS